MEIELIKLASSQGIWAALTIVLIFYILKTQEKRDSKQGQREENYQNIIKKLTEKFNALKDIKSDVKKIKNYISKEKDKED
ncbi:hypothetical protein G8S49_04270 [Clostridium botulinum C]|uniref:Uncharacterized protein n=3 Tax=Clostridium botulinum TaxID=1491 RepID=A0A9Q4TMA5_CLOBO|nr:MULTISPECIES: BhlA/UviB family holin-like peptide [Clostridium]EGO87049.1 phage-like protein [Clostridium botulinum C str. Stockholm]AYF53306.1 hypothetical protein DFH04_00425 [Clostridium novyi]EES90848.1 conserved domain protein [Clostridium botulinum D str. 1873]KEI06548.1 hypothetical protein Z957_11800 [Clostridium sp. K25]MBO3441874.1 hypothetical protein [Clostridium haemolyticum]